MERYLLFFTEEWIKAQSKYQSLRCEVGEFAILTKVTLFINKIVTGDIWLLEYIQSNIDSKQDTNKL